ncbi:MAG: hypothetical protein ORN51_15870 [Akkermansiaceae bacterium]|nr:hypothetical protein [Akkermansiaceae bacterium]
MKLLQLLFALPLLFMLPAKAVQPAIAAGQRHSLFLKSDGTVWSCGASFGGQPGDGTYSDRSIPIQVIADIKAITAGQMHSLFLKTDGTVWAAGAGNNGRLGDGSSQDKNTPVQVQISGVKSITAGRDFSLFLKEDGTVWGCGWNGTGQLGPDANNPTVPVQIPISNVTAISAGYNHSLFLKADGTVWACGYGGRYWSGNPIGDGTNQAVYVPKQIMTGCNSISASCGSETGSRSFFLSNDGIVTATGDNGNGELGDGTKIGRYAPVQTLISGSVRSVATGSYQSFFVKEDLSVWGCGYNSRGELGIGSPPNVVTTPALVMENTMAVASGETHSLFLKTDGSVWASGMNNWGALGDRTLTDRAAPVRIMSLGIMLNVTSTTGGTVTGGGAFNPNDIATLTAAPALGYLFTCWSGDITSNENPLTVTLDSSKAIRANFTRNPSDLDEDGLTYYDEVVVHGTNPDIADSDGDGFKDGFEVSTGFSPNLASSSPDSASTISSAVGFRFNAGLGMSYRIEDSSDLQNWSTLETPIIGEGGIVTRFYFTEGQAKRYFRVRKN